MNRSSYLNEKDVQKFIQSIPKLDMYSKNKGKKPKLTPTQLGLIFKLLYYCALSVEEVLKLKKSNFDLENSFVTIENSRTHLNKTTIPQNIISEISDYIEPLKNNDALFHYSR